MTAAPLPLSACLRPARVAELEGIAWLQRLPPTERLRAVHAIQMADVPAGGVVCTAGQAAQHWLGVVDGLLKIHASKGQAAAATAGMAPGGWWGEDVVLQHAPYRYGVTALRKSVVAALHIETFAWLIAHSLPFNHLILQQLNGRLGQCMTAREMDRIANPDLRVARSLAAMLHPVLSPAAGDVLRITQQELAHLVGLSRQRVNEALALLEAQGWIQVEYGGLRVLDWQALHTAHVGQGRRASALAG